MSSKILIIGILLIYSSFLQGQNKSALRDGSSECYRIMFYNTENLFDTIDNPGTNDNDLLPGSKKHWTRFRYNKKLNNIYKVIISIGEQPPAIIGLCEVENDLVLKNLIHFTPLGKFNYKFIHQDSPDPRGIDVAMLYRPDIFKPLARDFIRITFPFAVNKKTRDILYVKGIMALDTVHLFVNHFPSRARGAASSASSRNYVAGILRQKVDSLFNASAKARIIIMGDFNDEPDNESMMKVLGGYQVNGSVQNRKLYNLSYNWLNNIINLGTYNYRGKWSIFDQLVVSGNLINNKSGLNIKGSSASIYSADFLFKTGKGQSGKSPFRTYKGTKYTGGFSDHLPVYLDICNQ